MKVYIVDENDFQTAGQVIGSTYSGYDTPVITKETIMSKAIDVDTSNLNNVACIDRSAEEKVNEEKARTEIEPNMDRCHFIESKYYIDTDERVNWYIYNDVTFKEIITDNRYWRYEVIYNGKPYVYLSLEDACKFIENNMTL